MNRVVLIGLVVAGCGGSGFSGDLPGGDGGLSLDAAASAGGGASGGRPAAGGSVGSGGEQVGSGGAQTGTGGKLSSGGGDGAGGSAEADSGAGGAPGTDSGADASSGGTPGAGGSAAGSGTVKVGGACAETSECVPLALIPASGCVCPIGYPWCKTTVECISGRCYNARNLGCCAGTDCGL